jgi:hypothetical protein
MAQINMTASSYVTGNIDKNARERWVKAIPDAPDIKTLDDEELGKLARAGAKVLKHAKFSLNKLNQEGGKNSWTRKMSCEKNKIQNQIDVLEPFVVAIRAECDRRENEGIPAEETFAVPRTWGVAKAESEVVKADFSELEARALAAASEEEVEALKESDTPVESANANLFELFADTPQKELLELAYKGLEAGKSLISPEELANLREEVKVSNALCEELRVAANNNKNRAMEAQERVKKLEVENKKLRRVMKGVQTECANQANRLEKYTKEPETTN